MTQAHIKCFLRRLISSIPSDRYILQGIVDLLGSKHEIVRVGSQDGDITPDLDALGAAIDGSTALVTLSHVTFKSGYRYDMQSITQLAHEARAIVLWDLSHSVGAVPIALDECGADLAIGCTYKYLNGGPGSPAFLYVKQAAAIESRIPDLGLVGRGAAVHVRIGF